METQRMTLLLTELICQKTSAESGDDDVYLRIYVDAAFYGTYFYENPFHFRGGESGNVDITIDVTYANQVHVEILEKDPKDSTSLGNIYLDRTAPLEGTQVVSQTTGKQEARYGLSWRVIDKPIPTVRILGLYCQQTSCGCNPTVVEAVTAAAEEAADEAAKAIGKSPRPRAKAISKGFKVAADIIGNSAKVIEWIANAAEGKDEVYMQHIPPAGSGVEGGAFFPLPDSGERNYKMDDEEAVYFGDDDIDPGDGVGLYDEYFRFPLDKGAVTIQLREMDPNSGDNVIGNITIDENEYNRLKDEGAQVVLADEYFELGQGQGALYHICYSVGLENWARPATAFDQGDPGDYPNTTDFWEPWRPMNPTWRIRSEPALVFDKITNRLVGFFCADGYGIAHSEMIDEQWEDLSDCSPSTSLGGHSPHPFTSPTAVCWRWREELNYAASYASSASTMIYESVIISSWRSTGPPVARGELRLSSYHGDDDETKRPALASWGEGQDEDLRVFVRGPDGQLYHSWYKGELEWIPFEKRGQKGVIASAPSATLMAILDIHVVAQGTNGNMWRLTYRSGSGWSNWSDQGGGPIHSAPAICSPWYGRLDAFARSADGQILHRIYEDEAWGEWMLVPCLDSNGNPVYTDHPPAVAVNKENNRLALAVRRLDGTPYMTMLQLYS